MLHQHEIEQTPGEPSGIHDLGRLESAVAAPEFLWYYENEEDICVLAAKYALHIVQNHAFMAGNKRTGMAACIIFLEGNGYTFLRDDIAFGELIEQVINGEVGLDGVADFLRANSELSDRPG